MQSFIVKISVARLVQDSRVLLSETLKGVTRQDSAQKLGTRPILSIDSVILGTNSARLGTDLANMQKERPTDFKIFWDLLNFFGIFLEGKLHAESC